MDMNNIVLGVFPLSLTRDVAIWFTELPYDSIYILDQLRDVFLERYYIVSRKLNYKYESNNFVELTGESVSSSWEKHKVFARGVPNHCIDDESLKDYFYCSQD